jgi:FlaA1/EpsC-like NDP-sugar epimerase
VRFGNVFLSRGSVLETFLRQIELGEAVTVTDTKMTRYFMDIDEAAKLIIYVINEKLPGVSVFKMGDPLSIHELAVRLQKKMNAQNMNIQIIGLKPGEKIHEELFTRTEEDSIQDLGLVFNSMQLSRVIDEELITLPKDDADALETIDKILDSSRLLSR